jgi:hypothetical protein
MGSKRAPPMNHERNRRVKKSQRRGKESHPRRGGQGSESAMVGFHPIPTHMRVHRSDSTAVGATQELPTSTTQRHLERLNCHQWLATRSSPPVRNQRSGISDPASATRNWLRRAIQRAIRNWIQSANQRSGISDDPETDCCCFEHHRCSY